MAKSKSRFVCQVCGFQSGRALGRCTECLNWNCLVEEFVVPESKKSLSTGKDKVTPPRTFDEIESDDAERFSTGISQLDQVLGGGLVAGSVVLLAGDPGIGKSTLLLQLAKEMSSRKPILYISGEESAEQIKLRANRLGLSDSQMLVWSEQNLAKIEQELASCKAEVAIIDSIQSVYHPELTSSCGSVSQVRESAQALVNVAKEKGIATILVGHVTKDGSVAGPKVLEHMVDVVLQFEGDRPQQLRILRATKNRYGSTQEIGIFAMAGAGLSEVTNPSAHFLADRLSKLGEKQAASGTAILCGADGTRSLLVEVQALVGANAFTNPRRVANGWDLNRLLQILAVLEKKVGLFLSRSDVYINVVGGFDFNDPAGDLGVALAVATSHLDRSVDPGLVSIGEIGLSGEVRQVTGLERRLKEAARLGFTRALIPKSAVAQIGAIDGMKIIGVEYLVDALAAAMPGQKFPVSEKDKQDFTPEPSNEATFTTKRA
jgi:DNA repair protein RadA/Sms